MKRTILLLIGAILLNAPTARGSDVGVDLHLRLGDPAPPPVVIVQPPLFLYPPGLGFYVAVGVPYDCFFLDGRYYILKGGHWYASHHWGGPWYIVKHSHLPPGLVKHKHSRIVELRNAEYRAYKANKASYGGNVFHPVKAGGEGAGQGKGKGHGKGK